jgi:hypothetical protein
LRRRPRATTRMSARARALTFRRVARRPRAPTRERRRRRGGETRAREGKRTRARRARRSRGRARVDWTTRDAVEGRFDFDFDERE